MLSRLQAFPELIRAQSSSEAGYGRFWVITSSVLFGAMAVTTRNVSAELGAGQIAFVRFALDLIAVIVVAWWRPTLWRATRPLGLAGRGLLGGAAVLGYFTAIEHLSAGLGTMLNYTFPVWSSIFAAMFLGEAVTWSAALGMGVATLGLVVVIGPGHLTEAVHGVGNPIVRFGLLAGVASSIFGGAATTTIRWLRRTESALAVFGAFCAGGMIVSFPSAARDWRPISPHAAMLLLVIAILSFGGQMLYTYALKFVTAGAGSLAMQLTVVTSYGLAALFLGEPIAANTLGGGLLVMGGIVLVSRRAAPAPVTAVE